LNKFEAVFEQKRNIFSADMETASLVVRPLTEADAEIYFQLIQKNKERLANFFAGVLSRTTTLEDTKKFIIDSAARRQEKTYFPFLIFQKTSNALIGFLDLKNIDWAIPKAEIGCYVDADYSGKGVAKSAMHLFCDYAFRQYGFNKLFLRTHRSNEPAINVALKSGFTKEGVIRCDYKTTAGELVDLFYFGLLRREWEENQPPITQ
jgi:RimJ/RimL family protein N-acetyltransferase